MIQTGFGNETCRCKSSTEVHRTLRWTLLSPLRLRIPSRTSVTRGNWFSVRVNLETCLEAERSWWALIWSRKWTDFECSPTEMLFEMAMFSSAPWANDVGHTLDLCPVGSSGVQWAICGPSALRSERRALFPFFYTYPASPNGWPVSCLRPIETSP